MANEKGSSKHTETAGSTQDSEIVPYRIEDVRLVQTPRRSDDSGDHSEVDTESLDEHSRLGSVLSLSVASIDSWGSESCSGSHSEINSKSHFAGGDQSLESFEGVKKSDFNRETEGFGENQNQSMALSIENSEGSPEKQEKERIKIPNNRVKLLIVFKNTKTGSNWRQWVIKIKHKNKNTKSKLVSDYLAELKKRMIYCETETEFELYRNKMRLLILFSESKNLDLYGLPPVWFFSEVRFWPLTSKEREYHGAVMTFENRFLRSYYEESKMYFNSKNRSLEEEFDDLREKNEKKAYFKKEDSKRGKRISSYIPVYTKTEKVDFRAVEMRKRQGTNLGNDQKWMNDQEFLNMIGQPVDKSVQGDDNSECVIDDINIYKSDSDSERSDSQIQDVDVEDGSVDDDDLLRDSFGRVFKPSVRKTPFLNNLNKGAADDMIWVEERDSQLEAKADVRPAGCITAKLEMTEQNKSGFKKQEDMVSIPTRLLEANDSNQLPYQEHGNMMNIPRGLCRSPVDSQVGSVGKSIQDSEYISMSQVINKKEGLSSKREITQSNLSSKEIVLVSEGKKKNVFMGQLLQKSNMTNQRKSMEQSVGKEVTDFCKIPQHRQRVVAKKKLNHWEQHDIQPKPKKSQHSAIKKSEVENFIENEVDEKLELEIEIDDESTEIKHFKKPHVSSSKKNFDQHESESEIELEIEEDEKLSLSDESKQKENFQNPVTPYNFKNIDGLGQTFGLGQKDHTTIKKQYSTKSDVSFSVDKEQILNPQFSEDSLQIAANMEPGKIEKASAERKKKSGESNKTATQTEFIKSEINLGKNDFDRAEKLRPDTTKKNNETEAPKVVWERPQSTYNPTNPSKATRSPKVKQVRASKPQTPRQAFRFIKPEQAHKVFNKIQEIGESSMIAMSQCQNHILQRLSRTFQSGKRGSFREESSYMLGVIEKTLYKLRSQRKSLESMGSGT